MQQYLSFWAAWFGFMGTVLSLEFGLYQVAIADSSKQIATQFMQSSWHNTLGRVVLFSSQLSTFVFGPTLVSRRAFLVGFAMSAGLFLVAYLIALGTTHTVVMRSGYGPPPIGGNGYSIAPIFMPQASETEKVGVSLTGLEALTWPGLKPASVTRLLSWSGSIALTLAWLAFEFVFVVKSRWLIRFIGETTRWYSVIFLLGSDILSTVVILSAIAPIFIIIFGYMFLYAAGDLLNVNTLLIFGGYHSVILSRTWHLWYEYQFFATSIARDLWIHLRGDFDSYFVAGIGTFADKACHSVATSNGALSAAACTNAFYKEDISDIVFMPVERISFFATTFFVSTMATNFWMAVCALSLLVAKISKIPSSTFLWLHENPEKILSRFILPTAVISLIGGCAIPWLYSG